MAESALPPNPLTGGAGYTRSRVPTVAPLPGAPRPLPAVKSAPVDGYAKLLAWGWDSFQEAFNIKLRQSVIAILDKSKAAAKAAQLDGDGLQTISLGMIQRERVQVRATSAGKGQVYAFGNDDFLVMCRSQCEALEWSISVRYSSAALWEHGLRPLRERVIRFLRDICTFPEGDDDWSRVSMAHWCFDFHSPKVTADMRPGAQANFVTSGRAKVRDDFDGYSIGRTNRIETLTIGSKAGLQVQLYDKGREITDVSGKTWMVDQWKKSGYRSDGGALRHVWRLELRYGGDWLKDRNLRTIDQVEAHLSEMIAEALISYRFTVPTADTNRSRWPMHPLWALALSRAENVEAMVPLGRRVTGRRAALVEMISKNIAGTVRAAVVLKGASFDMDAVTPFLRSIVALLEEDPDHDRKVWQAQERYSLVDEAA